MADSTLNRFQATGTTAERTAFVPSPPTPASGPDQGYTWFDTDDSTLYAYDFGSASWVAAGGGSGTVTNTGTLTANALILGNGSADVTALGSLGTTTTVLHGNAAGAPTFGAVSLTADVSGDLPFANLAQIAGLSVLGVTGSSTADVAAITAATDNHVLTRVSSSSLAFAMPAMVKIDEQTPSGTGIVTFSSLGSYTHLMLVFNARGTQVATETAVQITLNADAGANYDGQRTGSSTADALANQVAGNFFQCGNISAASAPSNYSSGGTLILHDYRNTTFYKTMQFQEAGAVLAASSGNINSRYASGFWRSTAAVTSVTLTLASGNYVSGSKFTLYGLS